MNGKSSQNWHESAVEQDNNGWGAEPVVSSWSNGNNNSNGWDDNSGGQVNSGGW